MEVWEVVAREQIRDLVARYNASGDSGRFDDVMALFWADAEMETGGPAAPSVKQGIDEIRTIFTGTADRWRSDRAAQPTGDGAHYVRHSVSTLVIDFDDEAHARGYCYFSVVMPHGLDHWGRYFDRYEARDGVWKFARRRVTAEGRTGDVPVPDR